MAGRLDTYNEALEAAVRELYDLDSALEPEELGSYFAQLELEHPERFASIRDTHAMAQDAHPDLTRTGPSTAQWVALGALAGLGAMGAAIAAADLAIGEQEPEHGDESVGPEQLDRLIQSQASEPASGEKAAEEITPAVPDAAEIQQLWRNILVIEADDYARDVITHSLDYLSREYPEASYTLFSNLSQSMPTLVTAEGETGSHAYAIFGLNRINIDLAQSRHGYKAEDGSVSFLSVEEILVHEVKHREQAIVDPEHAAASKRITQTLLALQMDPSLLQVLIDKAPERSQLRSLGNINRMLVEAGQESLWSKVTFEDGELRFEGGNPFRSISEAEINREIDGILGISAFQEAGEAYAMGGTDAFFPERSPRIDHDAAATLPMSLPPISLAAREPGAPALTSPGEAAEIARSLGVHEARNQHGISKDSPVTSPSWADFVTSPGNSAPPRGR